MIGGLSSLGLPERPEPAYRAFALYLGASVVTLFAYTAAKATHLGNREHADRGAQPLLPLAAPAGRAALALGARKLDWRVVGGVSALVVELLVGAARGGRALLRGAGARDPDARQPQFHLDVQDVHLSSRRVRRLARALLLLRRRRGVALAAAVLPEPGC